MIIYKIIYNQKMIKKYNAAHIFLLLYDLTESNCVSVCVKENGWKSGAEHPPLLLRNSHICTEESEKSVSGFIYSRHHQAF